MPDHIQPTAEELKAEQDRILAELDKPEEKEVIEEEKETKEVVATDNEEQEETTEGEEEAVEEKTEDKEIEVKTPEAIELEKQKERYKESTKEAQRLYKDQVKVNQAMIDADNMPEPTEDDLKGAYTDWDDMSANERLFAKETLINKQWREAVKKAAADQKKVVEWSDKVTQFIEDPKVLIANPDLEGKQADFETFASDKKLVGYDFDILVASFLHGLSTQVKPSNKGKKMFEIGSGGQNDKPKVKTNKISVEESMELMNTNYNLYKEKLMAGEIEEVTV